MRRMHSYLVLLVVLVLGLSSAVPAEDLPDTAYDESDTQPYESNQPIANLTAEIASATGTALPETEVMRGALPLQIATPLLLRHGAKPVTRVDVHHFIGARGLLAQACTLLF